MRTQNELKEFYRDSAGINYEISILDSEDDSKEVLDKFDYICQEIADTPDVDGEDGQHITVDVFVSDGNVKEAAKMFSHWQTEHIKGDFSPAFITLSNLFRVAYRPNGY